MTIEVLSAPAYEPISLAEMRSWCRIDAAVTDHDVELRLLRKAMREYAENYTQRAFIQRSLRLYLAEWPVYGAYGNVIEIPFPPLVSLDSFKYRDTNGDLQTLAADQYAVHGWREPAIVVPEWNVTWPSIRCVPDALQLTFTAGYASGSPSDEAGAQGGLPESLRLWMQARSATLFEHREQIIGNNLQKIQRDFCDGLLDSLIVGTRLF